MIDRLVHHAAILGLKDDSYRLRDKGSGLSAATRLSAPACSASPYGLVCAGGTSIIEGVPFSRAGVVHFSTGRSGPVFNRR